MNSDSSILRVNDDKLYPLSSIASRVKIRYLGGLFTLTVMMTIISCSHQKLAINPANEAAAIHQVLDKQSQSWNKGDIDVFMEGYWNNENLTFVGSRGITYGWAQTLANYKKSYPTFEKMGKLKFDIIKTEILSDTDAYVLGKYTLYREADEPSGYFTLVWRKVNGQWKIISDQTSG